jgi:2-keto-4-pentenoate hydratase/2-oxohepta-3-ene-1,7-dioic acid hydratase in catechol pathway
MRLVRYGQKGAERPGILDRAGRIRDLSGTIEDITYDVLSPHGLAALAKLDLESLPAVPAGERLGQPVANVRKVVCTGPNYQRMSSESGAPLPSEPRIYMKADTAVTGPFDDLPLPSWAKTTHWEVELGVVIGSTASMVPEASALDHVAGYCVVNDITDRFYEKVGFGESVKGRSAPGYGPLGPWLVTKDEVPDPNNLRLWLEVDGIQYQEGNTSNMLFRVPFLISYISRFMTLRPGDVISTGTPGGVGLSADNPEFLRPGNVMRLGITGLGEQRTRVIEGAAG